MGKRTGAQNYNTDDVNALLDIAEELELLGANKWASVGARFQLWSTEMGIPHCEIASLNAKFDKLANTRNPTGDPSCLQDVGRAKRIAKGMLAKSSAAVDGRLEGNEEDEESDEITAVPAIGQKRKRVVIRVSPNKRGNGAKGVTRDVDDRDALIEYVGSMSNAINKLVENKTRKRAEVSETNEMKLELKEAHSSIVELKPQ